MYWHRLTEDRPWRLVMGGMTVAFGTEDLLAVNPYLPDRGEPNRNRVEAFLREEDDAP